MAAPSAALSISGVAHTSPFGCRPKKLILNRNYLQLAVPSNSQNANHYGKLTVCRAESEDSKGGGGFLTGFLIGGAVFGTLGYVFAPQISKTLDTLLNDDEQDGKPDEQGFQSVPRPRNAQYYDEGLEKTRQTLGDKISQLNLAIDKAAARLKRVTGSVEKEAVKDETEIEMSTLDDNGVLEENLSEQGFVQGESAI
ncbi:uncharacterized protein LOC123427879 [Hordeum vulgare subsp. vulgare]|uniref:Uncharacterized protein n=1 Tax=Hordeum vulgare subsp. vulgare TaxID=112509 RepID=A0A8I7B851_HORVV|nr:uncharacterized protein LOC123427879 [Hordeum vulgare subsp. vulgare]